MGQGQVHVVTAEQDMVAHSHPVELQAAILLAHLNQGEIACSAPDIADKHEVAHAKRAQKRSYRSVIEPGDATDTTLHRGSNYRDEVGTDHAALNDVVADLGAGWGYLSSSALDACDGITHIDLYEADARALDCARKNLTRHSGKASFHWHDVTKGLTEKYDAILMNPPFHSGQATDVDLGRAFIGSAIAALRRGGKLLLVANRQLPYEAVLESHSLAWRKIAEDSTYKVILADKR